MAKESTKHYLRNIDIDEKLISSIDNGIIILDDKLVIYYYNNWLELHTLLKKSDVLGEFLYEIFDGINEKTLKRKIKTALRMGTPTFYTASTSKYLIPIKINRLNIYDFEHMRQDVSVIPFDKEKKLVALIITDQTNMTNTNNLLEINIKKVQELNSELLKERDTIDKKVIFLEFNRENNISDISQAYLKLLGYEKDELLNHNFFEYKRLYVDDKLKERLLQSIDEKKVLEFENLYSVEEGIKLMIEGDIK